MGGETAVYLSYSPPTPQLYTEPPLGPAPLSPQGTIRPQWRTELGGMQGPKGDRGQPIIQMMRISLHCLENYKFSEFRHFCYFLKAKILWDMTIECGNGDDDFDDRIPVPISYFCICPQPFTNCRKISFCAQRIFWRIKHPTGCQ